MLVVATSHPKVPLEKLDSVDIDEAGRVGVKVGAAFELLVGKQVKLPCPSFLSRDIFLKQIFLVEDVDYVVVISAGLDQDNEVAVGTEVHFRSGFQWVKGRIIDAALKEGNGLHKIASVIGLELQRVDIDCCLRSTHGVDAGDKTQNDPE